MAPKKPEDMTIEEKTVEAVKFLHQALPTARMLVDNLTGVQCKRVLKALLETPLEQETPSFTTKGGLQLFNLGIMIQNAKFILFQGAPAVLTDLEKKAALEQAEKDAQEENKPGINEENNGN